MINATLYKVLNFKIKGEEMKKVMISLAITSLLFVGCGRESNKKVNCSKLKRDIAHQEKNVKTTRGEQYSSMLYLEKQCTSTSECIKLRKKQEEFFVLKLEELKDKYDESCKN